MSIIFSIVTPTYNRDRELKILFASLNKQMGVDFEWVIIDDGSVDNTRDSVYEFIKENVCISEIKYIYQENKGKNSAVNKGVLSAIGEYIIVVDSDDYLCDRALARIKEILDQENISERPEIIGVSGIKMNRQQKPVSFITDKSREVMSHYEWFYKRRRLGDRIDIYKAIVLRNNLFNHFPKEKFITEDALWLDLKGVKLFINEPLLIVDYLDGGLSSEYTSLLKRNPFGSAYYYYVLLVNADSVFIKYKSAVLIIYYVLRAIINNSGFFTGLLSIASYPIICLIKSLRK